MIYALAGIEMFIRGITSSIWIAVIYPQTLPKIHDLLNYTYETYIKKLRNGLILSINCH